MAKADDSTQHRFGFIALLLTVALAVSIAVGSVIVKKFAAFLALEKAAYSLAISMDLYASGFNPLDDVDLTAGVGRCGSLVFTGHIYGANKSGDPQKPEYPDTHKPMRSLKFFIGATHPKAAIFGGDNVYRPEFGAAWMSGFKSELPNTRFVLGNHDDYWGYWQTEQASFKEIYDAEYRTEEIDGVRLIYLHTVLQSGEYGFGEAQERFLDEALADPDNYRYALIFMHHALFDRHGTLSNQSYDESVTSYWTSAILPKLRNKKVMAVFAGDGGKESAGGSILVDGIPMFVSGWPLDRQDILPEWLGIRLGQQGPGVTRYRVYRDELHYVQRVFSRDELGPQMCRPNDNSEIDEIL